MGVEPDERDAAVPCGERLDGADVRAAATAEDHRALGKVEGNGEVLLLERFLGDHGGFRELERQRRSLDHPLATVPPSPRNAHEPRGELPPAGVALVVAVEGHRRVRQAVGTLGAEPRHQSAFS